MGRRTITALALTAGLLAAPTLEAHRFEHPKVLRLGIQGRRLLLAITYDVNPGQEALRTRGLFDRDVDGALDASERARLMDALEKTCWLWLKAEVDGAAVTWTRRERSGHRLDRAATDDTGLGLSLVYEAPLPAAGALTVQLSDRDRDAEKHVPLQVDLARAWRVVQASQGEWHPKGRQLSRVVLNAQRPLTLRLQARAAP